MDYLGQRMPDTAFEILELVTTGDRQAEWSLEKQGGKGLFTGELERALVAGEADLAIHSGKDLPTELGDGLVLAGYLPREVAHDVLVLPDGVPETRSQIATGSPRRRQQLARWFPSASFTEIRGNVETRLRKVAEGQAGCHRPGRRRSAYGSASSPTPASPSNRSRLKPVCRPRARPPSRSNAGRLRLSDSAGSCTEARLRR